MEDIQPEVSVSSAGSSATPAWTFPAPASGGVSTVTASSPLESSGGNTPNISIGDSTGTGSVVLSDAPSFTGFVNTNLLVINDYATTNIGSTQAYLAPVMTPFGTSANIGTKTIFGGFGEGVQNISLTGDSAFAGTDTYYVVVSWNAASGDAGPYAAWVIPISGSEFQVGTTSPYGGSFIAIGV
jgi:hypothetical protein